MIATGIRVIRDASLELMDTMPDLELTNEVRVLALRVPGVVDVEKVLVVVVTELEGKRHHPELGFFARQALRLLDDLRIREGRLDKPVPVGDDGGSLRVELNHTDPMALPAGFRLADNDTRILAVAKNLANDGCDVTVVSKDLPMRVKASACGLEAEEYRHEQGVDSGWTGMDELEITAEELDQLYERGRIEHPASAELPCHTGLVLLSPRGSG